MNEREINVLLAMPQEDDDTILESMRQDLQATGLNIGRIDLRSSKILVRQYLEMYQDTNVVIVTQHQTNDSYTPDELDELSMRLDRLCLIPIIDGEKGGQYVRQLEALGIYTALFGDDSDYETVAGLILHGRSKREARTYYGLEGSSYSSISDGYDAQNAVRYLVSCGSDFGELETRLALLSNRLNSGTKMMEVLGKLPRETFQLVSRMDSYRELCRLLEEERERSPYLECREGTDANGSSGGSGKKREKKASRKKKQVPVSELHQTVDIGFVSINIGTGCTYSAVMLAHSLETRYKVAIVEFDDSDEHFQNLCQVTMGTMLVSGITKFTIRNVDYFFHMPYSRFVTQIKPGYDYVIYDFGCADDTTIRNFFISLSVKFVITGGADWRLGELSEFVQAVARDDMNNSFIYLAPLAADKDMGNLAGLIPDNLSVPIPYEPNPYRPSKKTQRLLRSLVLLTYKKKIRMREVGIDEKAERHPPGPTFRWPVAAVISMLAAFLAVALTAGILQNIYGSMIGNVSEQLTAVKQELKLEQEVSGNLSQELSGLDFIAYSPKAPIEAGTLITRGMVDEVSIRTSIKDAYMPAADLGHVVAKFELKAGQPIVSEVVMEQPDPEQGEGE